MKIFLFTDLAEKEFGESLIIGQTWIIPEMVDEGCEDGECKGNDGEGLFAILFSGEYTGKKGNGRDSLD